MPKNDSVPEPTPKPGEEPVRAPKDSIAIRRLMEEVRLGIPSSESYDRAHMRHNRS
jgi:hypothetical protein